MNDAQKVTYAEDLLASGTATDEELLEAFEEVYATLPDDLSDADSETLLLAADLAIGASGTGTLVDTALETLTAAEVTPDSEQDLLDAFNDLNTVALSSAVTLIEAAEDNGAVISSDQYANAAIAQIVVIASGVDGGVEGLADATLSAEDEEDLNQALDWAALGGFDTSMLGDFSG